MLARKWRDMTGLNAEQRQQVRAAFVFLQGTVIPYHGVLSASRLLREGRILSAGRTYLGSLRRYLLSLVAPSLLLT